MDFSTIFQLRDKKFWWVDVIYYFTISLFVAMVFCYLIFLVKNIIQNKDIKNEIEALKTVGTDEQRNYEKVVLGYQKKFKDFNVLLKNHEFASNAFAFLEQKTRPNVWFEQFTLDEKNNTVQLSGEADNMESFSRQVADFEGDKYVKNVGPLSTTLSQTGKIGFGITLLLDAKIFSYTSDVAFHPQAPAPEESLLPEIQIGGQPATGEVGLGGIGGGQTAPQTKSSLKLITLFNLPLDPEVVGLIDQTKNIVTLEVPYGTDVTKLIPTINTSPLSTTSPAVGAPQNFTNSVVYTVKAEDGSIQNYTISVKVLSQTAKSKAPVNIIIFIIILLVVVSIIAGTILIILKKTRKE